MPLVIRTPAPTVGPQIARASRLAPRRWKKRPSMPDHRQQALVAGVAERQDRLGAVLRRSTPCNRVPISASASSHVIGSNRPSPFGPTRRSGWRMRSGAVDAVEEAVDLRAQLALAVRVVGAARAACTATPSSHGDLPAARVGAVVVARAVHDPSSASARRCPSGLGAPSGHAAPRYADAVDAYGSGAVTTTAAELGREPTWLVAEPGRARDRPTRCGDRPARRRGGRRVKAIGAGHSFTAAAATDGVQVVARRHGPGRSTSTVDRGRVTVQAAASACGR